MNKQYTLSAETQLPEQWPPVSAGVQLTTGEVGDEDKLVWQLITLCCVGKVIYRLQQERQKQILIFILSFEIL